MFICNTDSFTETTTEQKCLLLLSQNVKMIQPQFIYFNDEQDTMELKHAHVDWFAINLHPTDFEPNLLVYNIAAPNRCH